jgi:hypothetical protein
MECLEFESWREREPLDATGALSPPGQAAARRSSWTEPVR